jgi:two-component system response regulator
MNRRANSLAVIWVIGFPAFVLTLPFGWPTFLGEMAIIALGGADALQRISEVIPDAILLDLTMPGVDGMQVLDRLRSNPVYRQTRIVLYTGVPEAIDQAKLTAAGVKDVFIKATADIHLVVDRLLAD